MEWLVVHATSMRSEEDGSAARDAAIRRDVLARARLHDLVVRRELAPRKVRHLIPRGRNLISRHPG